MFNEEDIPYNTLHKIVHPHMSDIQKKFRFYDLFLIDTSGNVVYSVFKEIDYGTSVINGPLSDSALKTAYEDTKGIKAGDVNVTDFSLYTPSYDLPAGFISSPVYRDGKMLGVLTAQFPIDGLNKVMGLRDGMSETYLVGPDKLMRSSSYLDPTRHSVECFFCQPNHW